MFKILFFLFFRLDLIINKINKIEKVLDDLPDDADFAYVPNKALLQDFNKKYFSHPNQIHFLFDFETNESFSIWIDLILFHQFKGQKLKLKNLLEVLLKSNQLISSKCFQQQILQIKMKMKMIKQWNKPNKLKCNKNENKMKKVLDLNFFISYSYFYYLIFNFLKKIEDKENIYITKCQMTFNLNLIKRV